MAAGVVAVGVRVTPGLGWSKTLMQARRVAVSAEARTRENRVRYMDPAYFGGLGSGWSAGSTRSGVIGALEVGCRMGFGRTGVRVEVREKSRTEMVETEMVSGGDATVG